MSVTLPAPRPPLTLRLGDRETKVGARTLVMGVVNCTPDSFYDGGRHASPADAVRRYHAIVAAGADWIDVGGESTRPGADPVDAPEEWARVAPVLEAARRAGHPIPLSIDTTKAEVAARALDAGAAIINDISALRFDEQLGALAQRYRAALILMHLRGVPRTMQRAPTYGDVVGEVRGELQAAIDRALACGVAREQLIVDPGIGFGKSPAHNYTLLHHLAEFSLLQRPLLVGCSRKSLIGAVTDLPVEERLEGTLAAHAVAAWAGAYAVRVHDVRAHRRALAVVDAVRAGPPGS